jgi:hypothetical protein
VAGIVWDLGWRNINADERRNGFCPDYTRFLPLQNLPKKASMSVLTKCAGTDCQVKDACWRYVSPAGMYQYVWAFYATDSFMRENGCEYMQPLPRNDSGLKKEA